jgi:hypothetical protein
MAEALRKCGGSASPQIIARYQEMKLCDVVDILAQNGIRMVYQPKYHIDSVR